MKSIKYILIASLFLFISCEKVIDVGLETAKPKLVIQASINWVNGTDGSEQKVNLSTTTDYFSNTVPPVTDAVVFITNSTNQQFDFLQDTEPGIYKCSNFIPIVGELYTLTVAYQGEIYKATEKLLNTPVVKRVEQKNDAGILGNATEVKFFFDDLPNETNQYLLKIKDPYKAIPAYGVAEDRFFQNNEMFGYYASEKFKTGDTIQFTNNGITLNYYNYMNILISQAGGGNMGPFSTPTSTIRGNIINQNNFDNYALGYFKLSKTEIRNFIIE
ncbi:DUF4249 domain-containing protein [Flavobacterium sp.]